MNENIDKRLNDISFHLARIAKALEQLVDNNE